MEFILINGVLVRTEQVMLIPVQNIQDSNIKSRLVEITIIPFNPEYADPNLTVFYEPKEDGDAPQARS